jgi:hypothetical protein
MERNAAISKMMLGLLHLEQKCRILAITFNLAKVHNTSANLAFLGVFSYLMQYCALPSRIVSLIQKRWKAKLFLLVRGKVCNRNLANRAKDR